MRNPIGRLVAVGLVAAMTLAVTVGAASAWPPKGSFVIAGKIEHTMLLSTEEIADFLATTNPHVHTVSFRGGHCRGDTHVHRIPAVRRAHVPAPERSTPR